MMELRGGPGPLLPTLPHPLGLGLPLQFSPVPGSDMETHCSYYMDITVLG